MLESVNAEGIGMQTGNAFWRQNSRGNVRLAIETYRRAALKFFPSEDPDFFPGWKMSKLRRIVFAVD